MLISSDKKPTLKVSPHQRSLITSLALLFDSNLICLKTNVKYLFQEVLNKSEVQTRQFLSDPHLMQNYWIYYSVLWACSSETFLTRDKQWMKFIYCPYVKTSVSNEVSVNFQTFFRVVKVWLIGQLYLWRGQMILASLSKESDRHRSAQQGS